MQGSLRGTKIHGPERSGPVEAKSHRLGSHATRGGRSNVKCYDEMTSLSMLEALYVRFQVYVADSSRWP
jgi:hypothetical protein